MSAVNCARLQPISQHYHTPGISLFVRDAYASYALLKCSRISASSGPRRNAQRSTIAKAYAGPATQLGTTIA